MDVSNARLVEDAERKEKDIRRQELNDIRTVLSNASGRRLLWRLMEKCNTFQSLFTDPHQMAYLSGQQDIGHFIMSEIVEADEHLLFKIMKDNFKDREAINDN